MEPVMLSSVDCRCRFAAGKTGNDQGSANSGVKNEEEEIWNVAIQAASSPARTIC